MSHTPPNYLSSDNPFDLIAYLLFKLRHALEGTDDDRPPRWIRIAMAHETEGILSDGVAEATEAFSNSLVFLQELTLDLFDLLVQTDAAATILYQTAELVEAATSDDFRQVLEQLLNLPIGSDDLSRINDGMNKVQDYSESIPPPWALDGIGHELYHLLCIEQKLLPPPLQGPNEPPLPGNYDPNVNAQTSDHIIYGTDSGTGKMRMLQWSYRYPWKPYGLAGDELPHERDKPIRFGARRLYHPGNRPTHSEAIYIHNDRRISIFDFTFTDSLATADIEETHRLLDKLQYPYYNAPNDSVPPEQAPDSRRRDPAELRARLLRFQRVNDMPVTGRMDNYTINRLMGLDFSRKNIARAKHYDVEAAGTFRDEVPHYSTHFVLHNPNADQRMAHEQLVLPSSPGRYPYYKVGTRVDDIASGSTPPDGWIIETRSPTPVPQPESETDDSWLSVEIVEQFVAIKSRRLRAIEFGDDKISVHDFDNSDKWFLSEGEGAGNAGFFFYARGIQPDVPGRWQNPANVAPPDQVLFGPHPSVPQIGVVSQMYQWVDLTEVQQLQTLWQGELQGTGATLELYLFASVLQRALYRESKVDQGCLRAELYDVDISTGDGVKRPQVPTTGLEHSHSGWFPLQENIDENLHLAVDARKRNWTLRTAGPLLVPATKSKALIILEGKAQAGWDIDLFCDDVKVWWEMRVVTP